MHRKRKQNTNTTNDPKDMSNRGIHRHLGSYAAEALSSRYRHFIDICPTPFFLKSLIQSVLHHISTVQNISQHRSQMVVWLFFCITNK
ncbi:hypothetical protein HW49_09350 [Porphyromonadaceae bacterium COT-184 OH4590]|nr:hypothetical protein HW49_09350 [Porphyromonadaceae bacterium COT-184 OH4590]